MHPFATVGDVPKDLSERPSFLIGQLGYLMGKRFSELLRPLGIQPPHFGLLSYLADEEGQTQQQLADRMSVHRNVMVGLVDDLQGMGLVERRRHPEDRRAHALYLTDEGRSVLVRANGIADEHDTMLVGALDSEDQGQLLEWLQLLAESNGLAPKVHPALQDAGKSQTP